MNESFRMYTKSLQRVPIKDITIANTHSLEWNSRKLLMSLRGNLEFKKFNYLKSSQMHLISLIKSKNSNIASHNSRKDIFTHEKKKFLFEILFFFLTNLNVT